MENTEQKATASSTVFRFGLFELDASGGTLTRAGVRVKIQDQPFRVLIALLERPGSIISREELRQRLWPEGTYVDFDGALNAILKKLRAVIDDDPNNPRFIETVPRKGYRFIAPVHTAHSESLARGTDSGGQDGELSLGSSRIGETLGRPRRFRIITAKTMWAGGICLVVAVIATTLIYYRPLRRRAPRGNSEVTRESSVAVVPFANWGAGSSFDYLRMALASDIVTDLTYARSVSVRPFTITAKYGAHPEDPQEVGREMKVSYVISGYFTNQNGRLTVTAEMARVTDNRVVWRDTLSAAPNELIHLHDDFVWSLQKGVFAALGSGETASEIPVPHSQRAYDLYLRTVAMPRDPELNEEAIANLLASVNEDPNYAPAWLELGWRYYLKAEYAGGGEEAYKRSEEASARAAALDPNGTANWITIRTEHGDLQKAYDLAQELLLRRPDSSPAHFEMSYVDRYAGLLNESAKECDAALSIDPGNFLLRSCSKVFMYKGEYARARVFVDVDGNSGWSMRQNMQLALRQGNFTDALDMAKVAVQNGYEDSEVIVERLENQPADVLDRTGAKDEAYAASQSDPEEKYEIAAMLSFAGQTDRAIRVLRSAIKRNYCAVPLLDSDPLLDNLRGRPDFQELKTLAAACQRSFLANARGREHFASN